jgi:eukaryotic-like serine/threonine-protein kinase
MTPERWQQIRDVLEKTLELAPEQRTIFLNRACSSDSSLRQEVETLLAASSDMRSSFLQSPPPRIALVAGTKLGEYEIKSLLGAGGMGEVYRARDTRLGRDVAIKVLPALLSADSERLRRFEQEARAAASLNHPNILAVFQMGSYEGAPYLVSELLEGETLREQLRRGKQVVRKAIDYGVQVARGLAVAHEKGIVHRDLKPENLFVTKDGRVKILDFGLAKLMQPQSGFEPGAPTVGGETEPGMVMGTMGYMSPEQVRGQTADHRTDIFSFGAILYEMLAGKRAFQKPTSADTMSAILNEDPASISQITANIPPALQRVVHRCLEKNPEQRFQNASDLAFALDALSTASEPITNSGTIPAAKGRKWPLALAALLIVAVLAVFFWWRMPTGVPQITGVTQLTNDGVSKRSTTLSYDGSRLYFSEGDDLGWQIVEVSAAGGETAPVATTVPHPLLQDIAPDSSGMLITNNAFAPTPLWWQPLPAGAARRLGDLEVRKASILPDGEHIVYSNEDAIGIASRDGSNPQVLATVKGITGHLTVSPEGQRIRFSLFDIISGTRSLWDLNLKDHSLHQVLQGRSGAIEIGSGRWTSDGKYFVFTIGTSGQWDIWVLPEKTGILHRKLEPIRLSTGPLSYGFPTLSRDGTKIYTEGVMPRGELVRFDAGSRQFVPFLSGLPAIESRFSKDGKWFVYISYPDHELWRCRADGSDRQQLTFLPFIASYVGGISADDTQVLFDGVSADNVSGVFIANLQDGHPRLVRQGATGPTWDPDGKALFFSVRETGSKDFELQRMDLGTGAVSSLPDSKSKLAEGWSAQGKLVAFSMQQFNPWIFDRQSEHWSELLKDPCATGLMSPDREYLYCEVPSVPYHKVLRIRLSDSRLETMMEIKDLHRVVDEYTGTSIGVTPDGSVLLTRDSGTDEIYALTVKWP